jgi:hypothetical protein
VNLDYATIHNPQAARGAKRKIEDAVANMRNTVGGANYHGLAGRKISNANFRAEWQRAMGRRCSSTPSLAMGWESGRNMMVNGQWLCLFIFHFWFKVLR